MMLDITLSGRKLQGRYGYLAATPAEPHGALTGLLNRLWQIQPVLRWVLADTPAEPDGQQGQAN
jgi:hypothetical protein